jgi:hypothetical protein
MSGVYIHGTNGAGKTMLARCLMICAQGPVYECWVHSEEAVMTGVLRADRPDIMFVGKYRGATGGFDTVQPYAAGVRAAITRARDFGNPVIMESLITPGIETCRELAAGIGDVTFFWLDTPVQQCIAHVGTRRAARGNETPLDPSNLLRKAESVASWYRRLTEAGLRTERGGWDYVYNRCKEILNVSEPDASVLLD